MRKLATSKWEKKSLRTLALDQGWRTCGP